MANPEIERTVDKLIANGRISRDMRDIYIRDMESELSDHLLRAADYTNKTKELAQAKREAQAWVENEQKRLQEERRKLEGWYGEVKGELSNGDRIREEREAINARLVAAEQALKDYQIWEQVNPHLPQVNHSTRTQPTPTPTPTQNMPYQPAQPVNSGFITQEAFDRTVNGFLTLQNKVNRINAQHMKLYGEPLEDDLFAHFQQTGQDPEEYWRVKYAVDNRRNEIAAKQREEEIARIRAEAKAEAMREMAIDPSRVVGGPYAPKGGLTPLLEQYSGSRALAHSQNHANDNAATGQGNPPPVPSVPEMKSVIQSSRESIDAATRMYLENWDPTGNPVSERGKALHQKYLATA